MGWFSKKKKEENSLLVEAVNLEWVVFAYHHLLNEFHNIPFGRGHYIEFTSHYFPNYLGKGLQKPDPGLLLDDLCHLLNVKRLTVGHQVEQADLPADIPFESHGEPDFITLVMKEKQPYFANFLIEEKACLDHKMLFLWLLRKFVYMMLLRNMNQFLAEVPPLEEVMFVQLASIYFGFGKVLAENYHVSALYSDGIMQSKLNIVQPLAFPDFGCALGLHSHVSFDSEGIANSKAEQDIRKHELTARSYFDCYPPCYFNTSLEEDALLRQRMHGGTTHATELLLETEAALLDFAVNERQCAECHNSVGYHYIRMENFDLAIEAFEKGVKLDPEYAYLYTNLAQAHICLGNLEKGLEYNTKAETLKDFDPRFTARNKALYHFKKQEWYEAEWYFQKALNADFTVDGIHAHYAALLMEMGKIEEALEQFNKSMAKNDPEALTLQNNDVRFKV